MIVTWVLATAAADAALASAMRECVLGSLSVPWRLAGPAELTAPGWPWRSGALASTAYYLLVHVSGVVNPREGKVLVTSVFVAHGLLSDFSGLPLDFTEPVARLLHTMANVPQQPALPGAPKPAAAEKPAADETEAKKSK